jgi:hypothetical protein
VSSAAAVDTHDGLLRGERDTLETTVVGGHDLTLQGGLR